MGGSQRLAFFKRERREARRAGQTTSSTSKGELFVGLNNFELCSIVFACLYAPLFYIQKGSHLRSIHRIAFTPPAAHSSKERSGREYLPNTKTTLYPTGPSNPSTCKTSTERPCSKSKCRKENSRRSLVQIIMLGEIPLLSTKETIKYSTTSLCFVRGRVRRSLHISRVASPTPYRSKGMA